VRRGATEFEEAEESGREQALRVGLETESTVNHDPLVRFRQVATLLEHTSFRRTPRVHGSVAGIARDRKALLAPLA
jgi:hypothetical protein